MPLEVVGVRYKTFGAAKAALKITLCYSDQRLALLILYYMTAGNKELWIKGHQRPSSTLFRYGLAHK
jgi:hypothetical protein